MSSSLGTLPMALYTISPMLHTIYVQDSLLLRHLVLHFLT
jgi:hypothetical protein